MCGNTDHTFSPELRNQIRTVRVQFLRTLHCSTDNLQSNHQQIVIQFKIKLNLSVVYGRI
jgi:hypothetical protein